MLQKQKIIFFPRNKKRGQVWVETVIYTLIAFAMIGLVLTFARPKIQEIRDKAVVEQSLEVLEDINSIIFSLQQGGIGNKRSVDLTVKKGEFIIDGINDQIIFEMEGNYQFSEDKVEIVTGGVTAYTEDLGKLKRVTLTSKYQGSYDITFNGKQELRSLSKAPAPYKLIVSYVEGNPIGIDIKIA